MAHNSSISPAIGMQSFRKGTALPPSLQFQGRSFFPLEYPAYPTDDVDFDEWTDFAAYCGVDPEPPILDLLSNEDNASLDGKYFTPQPARPVASKNPSTTVFKMQAGLGIHSYEITAAQPKKPASLIVKFKLPTDKVAKILSTPQIPENLQAGDFGNIGEKKRSAHKNTKVLRRRR
ncbi:8bc55c37-794e-4c4e-b389-20fc07561813-CDS [Sclerotinia trifoliorum]|uniref:8bc55c37-794e-4c4e-b389-20fc07561813-CDS n=1 Tax=Sclerotinia trifoliorum TaxID=28548 RepID=A0A8H2VMP2_9HELO|nr:8bc55c37-794e-4c4e-b389-20fc07561813-CDS [Sclerotinia trifoliorum]